MKKRFKLEKLRMAILNGLNITIFGVFLLEILHWMMYV